MKKLVNKYQVGGIVNLIKELKLLKYLNTKSIQKSNPFHFKRLMNDVVPSTDSYSYDGLVHMLSQDKFVPSKGIIPFDSSETTWWSKNHPWKSASGHNTFVIPKEHSSIIGTGDINGIVSDGSKQYVITKGIIPSDDVIMYSDYNLPREYNYQTGQKFYPRSGVIKTQFVKSLNEKPQEGVHKLYVSETPSVEESSYNLGTGILKIIDDGKIKLRLPSHTKSQPREFVIEPQGNNKYYVHMRTWDGDHIPAKNLSAKDKEMLFEAVYNELPEGAEILIPKSNEEFKATRGTIAGLQKLNRDSRFDKGESGSVLYADKDGSSKMFETTSFIKR